MQGGRAPFIQPQRSTGDHSFAKVPVADIPRSVFDRSSGLKTAFDAGFLVPIFIDEALPGDTITLDPTLFARLATPLKPIMDTLYLDTFYFAVPKRLLWENWAKMNGEQENPGDSTDYEEPIITAPLVTGFAINSIFDYMGVPTGIPSIEIRADFLRAYNLVYNTMFRDQNLQNSRPVPIDDGPDDPSWYVLQRRGKRHDYFTSCLPWPQKGPAVTLPLGTSAQVNLVAPASRTQPIEVQNAAGAGLVGNVEADAVNGWLQSGGGQNAYLDLNGMYYADLSTATAATINALREAFQVQGLFENDARGGTRLIEIIAAHFGVQSPDARMQRPEYLGGASTPINVHPVQQTGASGATGTTTPQGNLAAFGTVSSQAHVTKSFTEHCVIIGLANVRAELTYQQGLDRMWSRRTRFDHYWPALAHLGEQPVLNKEIYAQGTADDELVFGYQERYAEYRYKPSRVCSIFRSTAPSSIDVWHLAQEFSALPELDEVFIVEDPPVDRVIAVPSEPHIILDGYFRMKHARPMPVFAVPGLINHF